MLKKPNLKLCAAFTFAIMSTIFFNMPWMAEAASTEQQEKVRQELSTLHFDDYGPQKAAYHLTATGGPNNLFYQRVLGSVQNHINAVGKNSYDIRIVMQGQGIDLLREATTDKVLSEKIDSLRAKGVRFIICRNSLVEQGTSPTELYKLNDKDIVSAAVAELTDLEGKGFAYIRP